MTTIIIILVVIAAIGTIKAMTKEERAVVAKSSINAIKVSGGYGITAVKDTAKVAYSSGQWGGNEISLNHQETITDLDSFNKDMTRKGAVRVGVKTAKSHLDTVGIVDANKSLDDALAVQFEALKTARAARA